MAKKKVGINHCIDFKRLDIPGIWSLLKHECITCDKHTKHLSGVECEDCFLIFNSSYNHQKGARKEDERRRVGCGKHFKQFGLNEKYSHVGKHQLYFFLFHPELSFKLPEFPPLDMFGNPEPIKNGKPIWTWHIHHLNGVYYDDRKENLVLCLNTEHKFIDEHILHWRWNY